MRTRVLVNTAAYHDRRLITAIAEKHGSQATVVGIDVRRTENGILEMVIDQGRERVPDDPADYAREVETLGAGEILLNSINRDGSATGYDVDAIRHVTEAVTIPVVACGGAGTFEHFRSAIDQGKASAVAAGNIFSFHRKRLSEGKTIAEAPRIQRTLAIMSSGRRT